MCFADWWNGFAGRIWPMGCTLENPDIDYEEEWWQHTPLSESNTNAERLWFNSVDTDTIFWARIQLLDGQQEAPVNTVLQQHPPKLFNRNPAIYLTKVDKICVYVFGMFPGFLENLLESGNLFGSATAATKTALGIIQLWFNYFRDMLAHTLPGRLSKEMPRSWFIYSCLPFCVWGWSICHSFAALPKRHATWHTRVSQTTRRSEFP